MRINIDEECISRPLLRKYWDEWCGGVAYHGPSTFKGVVLKIVEIQDILTSFTPNYILSPSHF